MANANTSKNAAAIDQALMLENQLCFAMYSASLAMTKVYKKLLKDLDILFLDALRFKPHPTHSTVENSLGIIERLQPRRAFFTHMCHDLGHEATNAKLPAHVRLSYDGMKLEFEI